MKKFLTKKNVLLFFIGELVLAYVLGNPITFGICVNTYTFANSIGCLDEFSELLSTVLIYTSLPALLFSLLTYRMRDEVFEHWMKFAKWAVPLLMILTYFMLNNTSGGGYIGLGQDFMALFFILLYGMFCIVSLWRIVRKYLELKKVS